MNWRAVWRPIAGAGVAAVWLAAMGPAVASAQNSSFAGLGGSWSGTGHIRLDNDQREAIRCSAHYTSRAGGTALGLSLRCASASGRVELRASLTANGSRVSGSWEERSYGVSGQVSGTASGSNLRLAFSGGLSGSMHVTTSGGSQSISVRTDTSALKGVNVSLRRN
jgi:hypothetical protein